MYVILYFRVPKKFCHLADSYLHEDQSQSRYKIYFKNLFQISAAPKFKFLIYFDFFWYFRDIFSLQSYKQYWKKFCLNSCGTAVFIWSLVQSEARKMESTLTLILIRVYFVRDVQIKTNMYLTRWIFSLLFLFNASIWMEPSGFELLCAISAQIQPYPLILQYLPIIAVHCFTKSSLHFPFKMLLSNLPFFV